MVNLIFWLGTLLVIIGLILVISFIVSNTKKRKERRQIEQYLMYAWDYVGKKEILKVRDCYEKIRNLYKSKDDPKHILLKRITLLYNKILEIESPKK